MSEHEAGWWRYAYVGQKVVCVEDTTKGPSHIASIPQGAVVTISGILARPDAPSGIGLCFEDHNDNWWYCASAFRPLVTKSTDAEVAKLKRLLNTAPAKERA